MNNYVYKKGEDVDNPGLLIPRYKALGRTAPNGKVYPEKPIVNGSEDDLVPVRSIVTKNSGDLSVITPDLIGKKFKDFTEGAAIGLSFGTSLTENITQSALGLKHGGHERVILKEGYLYAPKACEFREEGRWMYLKIRGGELKYPRPDNLVTVGKTKFEKDELICTAYETTSPIYKLNALIKLMRAKGSDGVRYFEKDNVIVSDCYAYEDGTIHYSETKDGNIEVFIGDRQYDYSPECMYYYPEGTEIKKFQRFCSGVVNMAHVVAEITNINDVYLIFRKQFYTLTDKDYLKTGLSSLNSSQEELVELLFTSLTNVVRDPVSKEVEEINYLGTQSGVMNKKSFYTVLSFGYSSRVISRALKGDLNLSGDVMTETILGLLLNNKLDDKK